MKKRNWALERLLAAETVESRGATGATDCLILALPLKERCLLRLIYSRGALWWEVAGAMGISIGSLRRRIRQTLKRTEDPIYLAMLRAWDRLGTDERRILYLHRVLGLSLREIIRQDLAAPSARCGRAAAASVTTLRRRVRQIEEKAARLARQVHRLPPTLEDPVEPEDDDAPFDPADEDGDLALTLSAEAQA